MARKSVGMFGGNHSGLREHAPGSAPSPSLGGEASFEATADALMRSPREQFQMDLLEALETSRFSMARSLVAQAEADAQASGDAQSIGPIDLITAKARIAMAQKDDGAARGILVTAIEAYPKEQALRTLLSEVMLAAGQATNVRPVLRHLGNPPSNPDAPRADPVAPRTQGKS